MLAAIFFESFNFSGLAVYTFLFAGVALFFVMRVVYKLTPHLFNQRKLNKRIERILTVAELFIWIIFFSWALEYFLKKNQIYALGVLIVLLFIVFWIARFAIKDLLAGVVFRASGRYSLNDAIKSGNYTGKITKFRYHTLQIETDNGNTVYIPYSQVLMEVSIKSDNAELLSSHTFYLNVANQKDINKLIAEIKNAIVYLPWSSIKKNPIILPIEESNEICKLKITVFSFDRNFFYKIEQFLIQKFEKNNLTINTIK